MSTPGDTVYVSGVLLGQADALVEATGSFSVIRDGLLWGGHGLVERGQFIT